MVQRLTFSIAIHCNPDVLLLDDGRLVFIIKEVNGPKIICQVTVGGELSNNKGINRKGGGLSVPALTNKDREDIKTAADIDGQ